MQQRPSSAVIPHQDLLTNSADSILADTERSCRAKKTSPIRSAVSTEHRLVTDTDRQTLTDTGP